MNQTMNRIQWGIFCLLLTYLLAGPQEVSAQPCDATVPSFVVDLQGAPDSLWVSPDTNRSDHCCGATNPDQCIEFVVYLDSNAVGINFYGYDGALPTGSLFYQINCDSAYPIGTDICLSGVGPHRITL